LNSLDPNLKLKLVVGSKRAPLISFSIPVLIKKERLMSCTLETLITCIGRPCGREQIVTRAGIAVLVIAFLLTPGLCATASAAPDDNPVNVTLSEYKIEMPNTLAAGAITFKVTNAGSKKHNFKIEGNGMEKKLKSNLEHGESETMQVDLKPGTYKVSCPILGHGHKGMKLDLTVTK
jgi:plastocyanin